MASFENLIGRKFNRLTVIEQAEMVVYSNGRKRTAWKCLCECGNSKVITSQALKNGSIRSCGCLKVNPTGGMYNFQTLDGWEFELTEGEHTFQLYTRDSTDKNSANIGAIFINHSK